MKFKRIIGLLVCFATVLGTVYCSIFVSGTQTVSAATVSDYQQYIKDLEAEQKEIEKEIADLKADASKQKELKNALTKRVDNLQSQIYAVNKRISDLDAEVVYLENEIELKTQELEETKYTFRQRLRAICMSGGAQSSTVSVLMSAENLEDLLTKTELTKNISAYDNALMQKIVDDMKTIEADKMQIAELKTEQEAAKESLKVKKSELDKQVSEINSVLAGLGEEIDKLQDKSDELEKAQKEYEEAIKNAQNVGSDQKYDGDFAWPCPGYYYVSSPYGYRTHPLTGQWKLHKGVDIAGSNIKGKPIVAAADGVVSIATYNTGGYGYYVMINHGTGSDGNKYVTLYAHMTKYIVSVGQSVKKGQTIGYVGTSGASKGYHLHFEIRINGNTTDPMKYY